jgi:hypothetical protein
MYLYLHTTNFFKFICNTHDDDDDNNNNNNIIMMIIYYLVEWKCSDDFTSTEYAAAISLINFTEYDRSPSFFAISKFEITINVSISFLIKK